MNSEHHFPYFTPRINSDRKNILSSKSSQGVVKYRILIKRRYYTWAKVNKIVLISKHFGTFLFRKTPPPENVVLDNQWFMFLCFPHLSRIYGFEKQESFTTVHRWNFWGGGCVIRGFGSWAWIRGLRRWHGACIRFFSGGACEFAA